MDRNRARAFINSCPVPTHRNGTSKLLLRTSKARRFRAIADEANRRDLYRVAILWFEEVSHRAKERGLCGQPEKSTGAYEGNGASGHSSWAKYLLQESRAQSISIPTKRSEHYGAIEGMEHRHHFHPFAKRICVPCSYHGLVQ